MREPQDTGFEPEPSVLGDGVLKWQGAAELKADGATRVGSLYLIDDILYFVDGGRTDKRIRPHAALLGAAGVLATAPPTIEVAAFLWAENGKSGADTVVQVLAALLSVALFVAGIVTRRRRREADEEGMRALGAMSDVPDLAFLDAWCIEDGGSFRVPVSDLDACTPEGDRGLVLVTCLLDRYELTVQPGRDALEAAVRELRE